MIIKRWNGTAFVEEFPKTKAQLVFNNGNTTSVFDENDRIKPAFLPNTVFDSLFFYSAITANSNLRDLFSDAFGDFPPGGNAGDSRSVKGVYFVATAAVTVTANSSAVLVGSIYIATQIVAGESGEAQPTSVAMEPGDWIIITNLTGAGTVGTPYLASFAVVNNTYELATTSIDGIVRLSSRTTYAALSGNNVVSEGTLKTVIDNASFAASGHTHGNILNGGTITSTVVAPTNNDTILIADTDASGKIERGITIGTGTTTYLRNDGTWGTPAGTYTLPAATATTLGGIELFSNTQQSVAANAVSTTASRTYGLQINSDGQGVINVPWTDTVYTLPQATTSALGGVRLGTTAASASVNTGTTTAGRFYHVGAQTDGTMYVNVPWTDTTYAKATATTLGLVEVFDATVQTTAANSVTTTAGRTYGVQLNSTDQMVVNVPWVDTNTTYSAGEGITLSSTTFRMTNPLYVQTATPTTSVTGTIWYDIN